MKYYVIAGEASGDLHAGNLIKNLKKIDVNSEFRGFGGDKMQEAGVEIIVHYKKMAFMGFFEVISNYKSIKNNFDVCYKDISAFKPDAIILIDYAGFNLRIAKYAKEHNIKTLFYISPKVWAWKKSRIKKIQAYIDQLYLILPFEEEFFKRNGYHRVKYVGNPLTDAIENFRKTSEISKEEFVKKYDLETNKEIIALLSGSRKQEIIRILPDMLRLANQFPNYQFVVAGAPSVSMKMYNEIIKESGIKVIPDQTYQLLSHAYVAIVTSGTATLETALFNVPQLVVYKFHHLSFIVGRPFIWIKYFSLVNIIMNKEIVKEFLQYRLVTKMSKELGLLLNNKEYYEKMLNNYSVLEGKVGKPGTSFRAAESMFNYLSSNV